MRAVSHSEASVLLDCGLKWDLAYGGRILGHTLAPLVAHPRLRDGRAWGRAVAALHQHGSITDHAVDEAQMALTISLSEDADQMMDAGVFDQAEAQDTSDRLVAMLRHYAETTEPLRLERLEEEILVPIPSRTGKRASNKYRLQCFFDGIHVDDEGRTFIVEFKLRGTLTDLEKIQRDRQIRWYAWAYREATGTEVDGVIVDERLNRAPEPPKVLKNGRPSMDQRQYTTKDLFREAVAPFWSEMSDLAREEATAAAEAFDQRRWQARHVLFFRNDEINEAGHQIVSAARQIALMESGDLYPTRNPNPSRCGGCQFADICVTPTDLEFVRTNYRITEPKSQRETKTA